jgi:hypothetical protein
MVGELPPDNKAVAAPAIVGKAPSTVGRVGSAAKGTAAGYIYTHKSFSIAFNKNQVIHVNLTSENPRPIVVWCFVVYLKTHHPLTTKYQKNFARVLSC